MARKKHEPTTIDLNLTSMLDVVFQLIVFFLLVSNFASAELPPMQTPQPVESKAMSIAERKRITVNLIPVGKDGIADGSGTVRGVRVGVQDLAPEQYDQLTAMLKQEADPNSIEPIEVDLRADKTIHYKNVKPVMDAITRAGISRVNLVAHTKPVGGGQ